MDENQLKTGEIWNKNENLMKHVSSVVDGEIQMIMPLSSSTHLSLPSTTSSPSSMTTSSLQKLAISFSSSSTTTSSLPPALRWLTTAISNFTLTNYNSICNIIDID